MNVVERRKEIVEMVYGDSKPKYYNNGVISSEVKSIIVDIKIFKKGGKYEKR